MTAKKGGLGRGLGRGLDAMISDTSKPRQAEKTPEKTFVGEIGRQKSTDQEISC